MSICKVGLLLKECFLAGIDSVQPHRLIGKWLRREGNTIYLGSEENQLGDTYLIGFGKAVAAMALEVETLLQKEDGGSFLKNGLVSVPHHFTQGLRDLEILSHSRIEFLEGAKSNLPDVFAQENTKRIVKLVESMTESDLLIVLISGGGSALLCMPSEPLNLSDKIKIIAQLSLSGASIEELNIVRIALSAIKGGRLALMTKAKVISFVLSDIIGNELALIASGPTILNYESEKDPLDILRKFKVPLTNDILTVLSHKPIKATLSDMKRVRNILIGDNKLALEGVLRYIEKRSDTKALILSSSLAGIASTVGKELANLGHSILWHLSDISRDIVIPEFLQIYCEKSKLEVIINNSERKANDSIVLIFGGETTVEVTGNGKGGRNQELILSASIQLEKLRRKKKPSGEIYILSGGTDGIDGPTDAAGAYTFFISKNDAFKSQVTEARMEGLNPEEYLKNNDSYEYFSKHAKGEYLIKTGHTGTNVMDIQILWIRPH